MVSALPALLLFVIGPSLKSHHSSILMSRLAAALWSRGDSDDDVYVVPQVIARACGFGNAVDVEQEEPVPFVRAAFDSGGCDLEDLREIGYDATQLKDAGFNATQLKDAGFGATDLQDAGFDAAQLRTASVQAFRLRAAGFDAKQLQSEKFAGRLPP